MGGIGMNVTFLPGKTVGLFFAGGYALVGFGWNAGMIIKMAPNFPFCPYVSAMYGYNAALKVVDAPEHNKFFYGPSFGLGFDIRSTRLKNYLRAGIVIPVRSDEYKKSINNPWLKLSSTPSKLGFSISYHFAIE